MPVGHCVVTEVGCSWYLLDISIYFFSKKLEKNVSVTIAGNFVRVNTIISIELFLSLHPDQPALRCPTIFPASCVCDVCFSSILLQPLYRFLSQILKLTRVKSMNGPCINISLGEPRTSIGVVTVS
jgi:hypothetical protein